MGFGQRTAGHPGMGPVCQACRFGENARPAWLGGHLKGGGRQPGNRRTTMRNLAGRPDFIRLAAPVQVWVGQTLALPENGYTLVRPQGVLTMRRLLARCATVVLMSISFISVGLTGEGNPELVVIT